MTIEASADAARAHRRQRSRPWPSRPTSSSIACRSTCVMLLRSSCRCSHRCSGSASTSPCCRSRWRRDAGRPRVSWLAATALAALAAVAARLAPEPPAPGRRRNASRALAGPAPSSPRSPGRRARSARAARSPEPCRRCWRWRRLIRMASVAAGWPKAPDLHEAIAWWPAAGWLAASAWIYGGLAMAARGATRQKRRRGGMIEGPLSLDRVESQPLRPGVDGRPLRELVPAGQSSGAPARVLDPLHDLQPEGPAGRRVRRGLGDLLRRRARRIDRRQGKPAAGALPLFAARPRSAHRPVHAQHLSSRRPGPLEGAHDALAARLRGRRAAGLPLAAAPATTRLSEGEGAGRHARCALSRRARHRRRAGARRRLARHAEPQLGQPAHQRLCLGPGRRLRRRPDAFSNARRRGFASAACRCRR